MNHGAHGEIHREDSLRNSCILCVAPCAPWFKLCFLFLLLPNIASATTYYIDDTGSDAANGLTPSTAKKSITQFYKTGPLPLQPGDTLEFGDGAYTRGNNGQPYNGASAPGVVTLNCSAGGNFNSGTAGRPITFRAAHERQAMIIGDGWGDAWKVAYCQYLNIQGFDLRNVNLATSMGNQGFVLYIYRSSFIVASRNIISHPNFICANSANVGCNAQTVELEECTNTVFEDNEVYNYRRHGISMGGSVGIEVRRNFVAQRLTGTCWGGSNFGAICASNSECPGAGCGMGAHYCDSLSTTPSALRGKYCISNADCGGGSCLVGISASDCFPMYPCSQCVAANNICWGSHGAMAGMGLLVYECANSGAWCPACDGGGASCASASCPGSTCVRTPSHDGQYIGNISINNGDADGNGTYEDNAYGYVVKGREYSGGVPLQDSLIREGLVVAPGHHGVFSRSAINTMIDGLTIYNFGRSGTDTGIESDEDLGQGVTCLNSNSENRRCSTDIKNTLILGGNGVGVYSETGTASQGFIDTLVDYSNVFGMTGSAYALSDAAIGDAAGNVRNSFSAAVSGMGTAANECLAWLPAGSWLRGAGKPTGVSCTSDAQCSPQHEKCVSNICRRHIGATILYATENKILNRSKPLWKNSTDSVGEKGTFVGCGAVVPGLNDASQTITCQKAHRKINAGYNGCEFPAGYVGWGLSPSLPSAPSGLRIVP